MRCITATGFPPRTGHASLWRNTSRFSITARECIPRTVIEHQQSTHRVPPSRNRGITKITDKNRSITLHCLDTLLRTHTLGRYQSGLRVRTACWPLRGSSIILFCRDHSHGMGMRSAAWLGSMVSCRSGTDPFPGAGSFAGAGESL